MIYVYDVYDVYVILCVLFDYVQAFSYLFLKTYDADLLGVR